MKRGIAFALVMSVIFNLTASEIWVSTTGNDKNIGSKDEPKLTIQSALRQAREMRRLNEPGIERGNYNCY